MLVDWQIKELCERGLLQPYNPELINPASIDIRIGYSLKREANPWDWLKALIRGEPTPEFIDVDLSGYSKSNPYWVWPKGFVLVASLETFNIPDNYTGEFRLKSSSGRRGWNNVLAMHIDCGYHGSKLTMELVVERLWKRLALWPGQRIGQLLLTPCETPENSYRVTGRYNNDQKAEGDKTVKPEKMGLIRKLKNLTALAKEDPLEPLTRMLPSPSTVEPSTIFDTNKQDKK